MSETIIVYALILWGCWLCACGLCEFTETTSGASPGESPVGTDIACRAGTRDGGLR